MDFDVVRQFREYRNCDIVLINNDINQELNLLIDDIIDCEDRRNNVALFLTTNGGSPHIAYRLCKALQRNYDSLYMYLIGPCKSAGTLIAIGANELIFGQRGELGPLDIQTDKPDDFFSNTSGLDSTESVRVIANQARTAYHAFFQEILAKGSGTITTTTAGNIAIELTKTFIEPISQQIDPNLLGEMNRKIRISTEYGKRLYNPFDDSVRKTRSEVVELLTGTYPSHGFVVDYEEASELFDNCVRKPNEEELPLINMWRFQRYINNSYIELIDNAVMDAITKAEADIETEDEESLPSENSDISNDVNHAESETEEENGK